MKSDITILKNKYFRVFKNSHNRWMIEKKGGSKRPLHSVEKALAQELYEQTSYRD